MTKRTAYEEMAEALGALLGKTDLDLKSNCRWCGRRPMGLLCPGEDCRGRQARAALARAKKVPVEVGMYGTGAREDLVYHRVFGAKPTPQDVAWVKRESAGHKDCVCIACACKRQLETGRGTL